jgi:hypothetical protein
MEKPRISITDGSVRITDLEIVRRDIADFLGKVFEAERESAFIRAVEVGVFCLERAQTGQDTDFVRRQVEGLISKVETATEKIPERIQTDLLATVGADDGQVLAPIKTVVSEVSITLNDRIREVKDLLSGEIDPAKETTVLGKALRSLRDMLDPQRTDSVQGAIQSALARITTEDGALAKAVKSVVSEAVGPLVNQVSDLSKEVRGQEAAAEALAQTAAKGGTYEEEVVSRLQAWAPTVGAQIEYVGVDNKPGDVLVRLSKSPLADTHMKLIIEVRDRQSPKGRKQVSDDLATAMAERSASSALYLSRNADGFGREIGEWAEGESELGSWVACTDAHLSTAIRFLIVQGKLKELRTTAPEVDAASIVAQIQRIRTSLERVKHINRCLTNVKSGADSIKDEAEGLRDEVRDALTNIEEAIRIQTSNVKPANAA